MDINLSSKLQDLVIIQNLDTKSILKEQKIRILLEYYNIKQNNPKLTQEEICKKIGISSRTFARYKLELGCKEEINIGKKYKRLHYIYDEEMDEFSEDKNGDYIWSNKQNCFIKDNNTESTSSRKEMTTAKRNKLHQSNTKNINKEIQPNIIKKKINKEIHPNINKKNINKEIHPNITTMRSTKQKKDQLDDEIDNALNNI